MERPRRLCAGGGFFILLLCFPAGPVLRLRHTEPPPGGKRACSSADRLPAPRSPHGQNRSAPNTGTTRRGRSLPRTGRDTAPAVPVPSGAAPAAAAKPPHRRKSVPQRKSQRGPAGSSRRKVSLCCTPPRPQRKGPPALGSSFFDSPAPGHPRPADRAPVRRTGQKSYAKENKTLKRL